MNIYLAGKISKNCWRHELVPGLRNASDNTEKLEYAILDRHTYVGPWFKACGHGCFHLPRSHGLPNLSSRIVKSTDYSLQVTSFDRRCLHGGSFVVDDNDDWDCTESLFEQANEIDKSIVDQCIDEIRSCDLLFAWIHDATCFGTLAEIGFAKGIGKATAAAIPLEAPGSAMDDLWFALTACDYSRRADNLVDGFKQAVKTLSPAINLSKCESPIEAQFCQASSHLDLDAQISVGPYRIDFAHIPSRIAVELDGHDFHKSRQQRTHDARRDRYLSEHGWRVVRFTGSEIHRDTKKCVAEVGRLIGINSAIEQHRSSQTAGWDMNQSVEWDR